MHPKTIGKQIGYSVLNQKTAMVNKKEIDFTYTFLDNIFRLSIGETGDFSGAMYNNNFEITLEEAQKKKHEFIAESLNIKKGTKVLDMGCGWGGFLQFLKTKDAHGTGVTLSEGQAEAGRKNGLNVHLMDCRTITPDKFGTFDAVVSVGAFEHFCSVEEWKQGKQDLVYQDFFKKVANLLPSGGRLYLQTMVFGKNMIAYDQFNINADPGSNEYILALMEKQFPKSWLPYGENQVSRDAGAYFKLISKSSGRLDYIETIKQWRKRFREFNFKKYIIYLSLLPRFVRDPEFRHWVSILSINPNKVCFERELMDHYRLVYEKI
jgi:cyclopropane-fatty-acyl-phospholipid synthase